MEIALRDTRTEMIRFVFPRFANPAGNLYGGWMMYWIVEAGMLAAARVAEGSVVLASLESLDFEEPVRIGDVLRFRAYVEYVGRSSMEVAVFCEVRHAGEEGRRLATQAYLCFVAIDEQGRPRPVPQRVVPLDPYEEEIQQRALARRKAREGRIARRHELAREVTLLSNLRRTLHHVKLVMPDDTVFGDVMFAGRLFLELDQASAILALRTAGGPVVTASLDAVDFYAPARVGNALDLRLHVNYVGRTSMEIGAKILAEDFRARELRHVATAFLTFVHLGPDGRPAPIPGDFTPQTPEEQRLYEEALARRKIRLARRKRHEKTPGDSAED